MRYGIIGTGMMGQEHMRNIALLPDAEIVALSDPDDEMRERALALAAELGHRPRACAHHGELLDRSRSLDALVIAAPNHLHHAIMVDALASDLPILCEKPLATTAEDAWDLAASGADRAAPVWVAMEYRFMPPVATLIEAVHDGSLGPPHMLAIREHRFPFLTKVGNWNRVNRMTGGTMVEKCCHFFDLMRLILDAEPTRLYATGGQAVNHRDETFEGERSDIIDHGFVVVDFEGGRRASLDLCMFAEGSWWQEEVAVMGSSAKIEARVPGPARFWPGGEEREAELILSPRLQKGPVKVPVPVDDTVLRAGDHHGSTFYQHRGFARLVREGGRPAVTLEDGAMAVELGLAAETSIRTGEAVTFDWRHRGAAEPPLAKVG